MENIVYHSDSISDYLSTSRVKWNDFYKSEKEVITNIFQHKENIKESQILDIGCGCGGLGLALNEKFKIENYTGVEINKKAAEYGNKICSTFNIMHSDFLKCDDNSIANQSYDYVFSLGCIDWQLNFDKMFKKCWDKVIPGGFFILSLRLTSEKSITDIEKSFQYANYNNKREGEVAPYMVWNAKEIFSMFNNLSPSSMEVYGYYGKPSFLSNCPYDEVCFTVIALQKASLGTNDLYKENINLPKNIYESIALK